MLLAFSSRANLPSIDTFSFLNVGFEGGITFSRIYAGRRFPFEKSARVVGSAVQVFLRQPREHPYSKLSFVWDAENSLIKDRYQGI